MMATKPSERMLGIMRLCTGARCAEECRL